MKYIVLFFILTNFTIEVPWMHKTYLPMEKVVKSINQYYSDCMVYPTQIDGLESLIYSKKTCWKGPYASEKELYDNISKQKYIYLIDNNNTFSLISVGEDGILNTNDDFKSTDNKIQKATTISIYISKSNHQKFMFKMYVLLIVFLLLVLLKYHKKILILFLPRK